MQRFSRGDCCAGAEQMQRISRGAAEVVQRCRYGGAEVLVRCRGSDEVIVQVIVQVHIEQQSIDR